MNYEELLAKVQNADGDLNRLTLTTVDIVVMARGSELRDWLEAAAVPHWFDARVLAALMNQELETATLRLEELATLPMVEEFAARNGRNIHEATRLALRRHLSEHDPERLRVLSTRAADFFAAKNESAWRIETMYHRLISSPDDAAIEVEQLRRAWRRAGRHDWSQALGFVVNELLDAGELAGIARAWALVCVGWIREGRLPLPKAEAMSREALKIFRALHDERGEMDTRSQLGHILATQGKRPEALAEYRAAGVLAEKLLCGTPDDVDWQQRLAVVHAGLGGVFQGQGQLAESLQEFEVAKSVLLRLLQRDPENTDWQRDLAVSHNRSGAIREAFGQFVEALNEFDASHEILSRLTVQDSDNSDWQLGLAATHYRRGGVYKAQGGLHQAAQEFEAGKQILLNLTRLDPENSVWQHWLGVAHNSVAGVYEAQGRLTEALHESKANLLILERLVSYDPSHRQWQDDLAAARQHAERLETRIGDSPARSPRPQGSGQ